MANRLKNSKSAYLSECAEQPVDWYPYCDEAFKRAKLEDKPVLIDIGASWCHWCHVMDKESYNDPELAAFLNENFICIKVDRDEMPHVDRKYQEAISALTGQGGWPLTVFALPSGEAFYGGTYFPKEDRGGMPSFIRILKAVLMSYKTDREKTVNLAKEVSKAVQQRLNMELTGELEFKLIERGIDSILTAADPVYGGFGFNQKFPMPTAIRLLITTESKFDEGLKVSDHTLDEMYAGGIHDHTFGGFFRYTVDREWIIPHFEKISVDNGELLVNYSIAFRNTGRESFKDAAEGIFRFCETFLDAHDGFYASIDADFRGEEGGFYTYSYSELESLLSQEEMRAFKLYYGISETGNFEGKNHLRIEARKEDVAEEMQIDIDQLDEILENGRNKLISQRIKHINELNIDRNVYTSYSSIIFSGYIYFGLIFGREDAVHKAVSKVKRIFKTRFGDVLARRDDGLEGLLEDYAFFTSSLLDCYTATLDFSFVERAKEIVQVAVEEFYRQDTFTDKEGITQFFDVSYRSPLTQMIQNTNSISILTGESHYYEMAERALKKYAGLEHGLYDAGYMLSLKTFLKPLIVEAEVDELKILNRYINHDTVFKEGKTSVCVGNTCRYAKDSKEIEKILIKEMNIGKLNIK
jgi:hypothetical protein